MKKYITTVNDFYTFNTPNSSVMLGLPKGTILVEEGGELYFDGRCAIDSLYFLLYNGFIKEYTETI